MDEPDRPDGYVAPPAFAPPAWRVAPLNEVQVLGGSSYPPTSQPSYPPASAYASLPGYPAPSAFAAPARRSARRVAAGVIAVVTAAVVVIAVVSTQSGGGSAAHQLTVPESAGAYNKVSTISGSQLRGLFTGGGGFANLANQDLDKAKVGLYERLSQTKPSMLFIGFDAVDSPVIGRQLRSEDPGDVADDVILGAGSSDPPLDVDAGPLGGALRCGHVNVDGDDGTVGVWADPDTLGIVLVLDPTHRPGTAETGAITRAVRAGAEH